MNRISAIFTAFILIAFTGVLGYLSKICFGWTVSMWQFWTFIIPICIVIGSFAGNILANSKNE